MRCSICTWWSCGLEVQLTLQITKLCPTAITLLFRHNVCNHFRISRSGCRVAGGWHGVIFGRDSGHRCRCRSTANPDRWPHVLCDETLRHVGRTDTKDETQSIGFGRWGNSIGQVSYPLRLVTVMNDGLWTFHGSPCPSINLKYYTNHRHRWIPIREIQLILGFHHLSRVIRKQSG